MKVNIFNKVNNNVCASLNNSLPARKRTVYLPPALFEWNLGINILRTADRWCFVCEKQISINRPLSNLALNNLIGTIFTFP